MKTEGYETKLILGKPFVKVPCMFCGLLIWVSVKDRVAFCNGCTRQKGPFGASTGGGVRVLRKTGHMGG